MSNQLISGEYFYKGRINYFLVKCHIYQGNKQIYNIIFYISIFIEPRLQVDNIISTFVILILSIIYILHKFIGFWVEESAQKRSAHVQCVAASGTAFLDHIYASPSLVLDGVTQHRVQSAITSLALSSGTRRLELSDIHNQSGI